MRLLTALPLVSLLCPPSAGAQELSPLAPDTVLQVPGGPRIVVLRNTLVGVVALRLSVPFEETSADAGSGAALALLASERMEGAARQVGATVDAARTPWGLAYSVTGAEIDVEYLTYLLRLATTEPAPDLALLARAKSRLNATLQQRAESPRERLLSDIRGMLAPDRPPLEGTAATLPSLTMGGLADAWRRSHTPARMTLVVETGLEPAALLAMIGELGTGPPRGPGAAAPPGASTPEPVSRAPARRPAATPATLRVWRGLGWVDPRPLDPHAEVLAAHLGRRLESGPSELEMSLRVWQLSDRTVFAVTGAAYPRRATEMRRLVDQAISQARATLDEASLATLVSGLALAYRERAGTPTGLVGEVGRVLEATGDPHGAAEYLEGLERVTVASLGAYIDRLGTPVELELRP